LLHEFVISVMSICCSFVSRHVF